MALHSTISAGGFVMIKVGDALDQNLDLSTAAYLSSRYGAGAGAVDDTVLSRSSVLQNQSLILVYDNTSSHLLTLTLALTLTLTQTLAQPRTTSGASKLSMV